jgi:cytochrome c oxidase subunit 2
MQGRSAKVARRARSALCLAALAIMCAACGSSGSDEAAAPTAADIAHGRMLFQTGPAGKEGCALCHTLAAARAHGPFGPDLDAEVPEWKTQLHETEQDIRKRVRDQIAQPACASPSDPGRCMPKDLFKGDDAGDVAAFVARCGGRSGKSGCEPVAGGLRGLAGKGQDLFVSRACIGCHWADSGASVGPSFHGLAGSDVELQSGEVVKADDHYLLFSILAPDLQVVKGYQAGLMSSRIGAEHITRDQAEALVAYVKSQK